MCREDQAEPPSIFDGIQEECRGATAAAVGIGDLVGHLSERHISAGERSSGRNK